MYGCVSEKAVSMVTLTQRPMIRVLSICLCVCVCVCVCEHGRVSDTVGNGGSWVANRGSADASPAESCKVPPFDRVSIQSQ